MTPHVHAMPLNSVKLRATAFCCRFGLDAPTRLRVAIGAMDCTTTLPRHTASVHVLAAWPASFTATNAELYSECHRMCTAPRRQRLHAQRTFKGNICP